MCKENTEICLEDAAMTVFLNTKGSRDGIDDELRAFLDYLETQTPTDDFTSCLDMNVIKVNGNSKWREKQE